MARKRQPVKNILIVGVGGQGVILASDILSEVAMRSGLDVKKSEVHGMAQRGGIVSSHVRYGEKVDSPLIPKGKVDVLMSFELAEAVRWLGLLSPEGRAVVNSQRIVPPIVSTGLAKYPEEAEQILRSSAKEPILVDALGIAEELGNPRLVNIILLGITSTMLDLPERNWKQVVAQRVPQAFKDLNLKAFDRGRSLAG
ncbi:MAG: indolepyruvate oxidoreductase subunit beta [Thermodesulfobacteriota bacterium]